MSSTIFVVSMALCYVQAVSAAMLTESRDANTTHVSAPSQRADTMVYTHADPPSPLDSASDHVGRVATWLGVASVLIGVVTCVLVLSGSAKHPLFETVSLWWRSFAHYWWYGLSYDEFPFFADDVHTRVYIRSIAIAMSLWSLPHYRNGSFQEDMAKNLRNVAIPGTGLPLSFFCRSKLRFYVAILLLVPATCLYIAAFGPDKKDDKKDGKKATTVAERFAALLLRPTDWFTLWRINCCLASYHAHVTASVDFRMEDKWTFLDQAEKKGIPVTPSLDIPEIVVKDRNEEGGMGIHFFTNTRCGGRWVIQKVLKNAPFIANLLPKVAPLSTIRIVTASRVGLASTTGEEEVKMSSDLIEPLSCVLRLGRENALTDHDAILFDADLETGEIRTGTVNKSWYKLGVEHATLSAPSGPTSFTSHPDSGVVVTGKFIPNMDEIRSLVVRAHYECCPEVPLCGWDVAISDVGIVLLEVNLSCNFFQAAIDFDKYFCYVDAQFRNLEKRQMA